MKKFYSVAQHSVIVASVVPFQDALWGLLHDASEAYLVDLPSPIKKNSLLGEEYQKIEKNVMGIVAKRFGISRAEPPSIHYADMILLRTEMRDLMGCDVQIDNKYSALPFTIEPWSPDRAEQEFLATFMNLLDITR